MGKMDPRMAKRIGWCHDHTLLFEPDDASAADNFDVASDRPPRDGQLMAAAMLQATGVRGHTTLGGTRSYQGMSPHDEATTGAIGGSALRLGTAHSPMNAAILKPSLEVHLGD
jgi:hypothetical protein